MKGKIIKRRGHALLPLKIKILSNTLYSKVCNCIWAEPGETWTMCDQVCPEEAEGEAAVPSSAITQEGDQDTEREKGV